MIHHSVPGERSFAILQEAVYHNSNTYGRASNNNNSDWKSKGSTNNSDWKSKCSSNNNNSDWKSKGTTNGKMMMLKPSAGYTISSGTGHIYANAAEIDYEQNIPPNKCGKGGGKGKNRTRSKSPPKQHHPAEHPPPLPPKRTTSLMDNQLFMPPIPRLDSISVNPKRVSIATSTFWDGHPDLGHFVSGWELGRDESNNNSVWGTTERGGSECVNIWGDPPAVKKGILLLQRDKLLSRWKERYCILTRDYLHCFRRTTSIHRSGVRLSEMGTFMFKLRLADVETIEWESRKSGPIIVIFLPQESRLLIRTPSDTYEALEQWHTLLQECIYMSKERRRALRHGSSTNVSAMTTLKSTISKASEPVLGSSSSSSGSSCCHTTERSPPHNHNHSNQLHAHHNHNHLQHDPYQSKSSMLNNNNNNNIGRMSLKLPKSNGKIDNVKQYEQEEQDYEDVLGMGMGGPEEDEDQFLSQIHFPVNKRCTRASIAVVERNPGRPSMTLHDFVKNPWKSGGGGGGASCPGGVGGGSKRSPHYLPGDYSMPRDAIVGKRPESWHTPMYRGGPLDCGSNNNLNINNHHHHSVSGSGRSNKINGSLPPNGGWIGGGGGGGMGGKSSPMMAASFGRTGKDSLYSTSRHTSEITFRKMS